MKYYSREQHAREQRKHNAMCARHVLHVFHVEGPLHTEVSLVHSKGVAMVLLATMSVATSYLRMELSQTR